MSGTPYWTSTEALFATDLPEHLVVIGSSVVALEIAQAYRRLGSEVTVLARHTLLYREDPLLGEELEKCFKKEGINVLTYTSAKNIAHDGKQFIIDSNNGQITSDRLLVSTGRHANTKNSTKRWVYKLPSEAKWSTKRCKQISIVYMQQATAQTCLNLFMLPQPQVAEQDPT